MRNIDGGQEAFAAGRFTAAAATDTIHCQAVLCLRLSFQLFRASGCHSLHSLPFPPLPSCSLHPYLLCRTGEPLTDPTTGAVIPAGTDIQLLLHTLHTHPAHWGPDALRWDPDRWLLGAPNGPRCPDVFMPFLDGLRRCAGMYLAETEFTLLTYALLVLYDTRVAFPLVPSPASTAAAAAAASPSEAALRPPRVEWITHSAIIPAAALSDASAVAAAEAAALGHPITATGTAAEATGVSGASCTAAAALAGASLATGEQQSQQQLPRWKLRLRADMFSAFDGVIPFTVSPRWR